MKIIENKHRDVFLIEIKKSFDLRGDFIKTYNSDELEKLNINFVPKESYISSSNLSVLRGMHYQVCEYSHEKLITCLRGKILDVIVDVRPNSKYFNKPVSHILSEENPQALLIGKGYAHGYLSLSENTVVSYLTSTVYAPKFDCGVLWSSIDFKWPIRDPILSERDKLHPLLGNHKCEFS